MCASIINKNNHIDKNHKHNNDIYWVNPERYDPDIIEWRSTENDSHSHAEGNAHWHAAN